MKKAIILLLSVLLMMVCAAGYAQMEKNKKDETKMKGPDGKMKMNDADFPYQATYSSKFEMGNPAHAKKVLEIWKDFDNNTIQNHADYFADTVMIILSDGHVVRGKDSLIAGITQYRSSLGKAVSTVDAWLATRSIDRNEDWVSIWGTETDTATDGTVSVSRLNEIWQLNKDGKVAFIAQYVGKAPPM